MNNQVIARIDISTPAGRKIARELRGKKSVQLEYPPLVEGVQEDSHDWEDAYEAGLDKLSALYATDMRALAKKHNIKI
jgi:hypothetical protein